MEIILVLLLLLMFFYAYMFIRNGQVHAELMRRTREVDELCHKAIEAGAEWGQYWDEFEAVSYDEMMIKFWVWPLSRF